MGPNLRSGGLISVLNSWTLNLMITWLEEAYGIDESYEAICQILATDSDRIVRCTCPPNLYGKLHSLAYVAWGEVGLGGCFKGVPPNRPEFRLGFDTKSSKKCQLSSPSITNVGRAGISVRCHTGNKHFHHARKCRLLRGGSLGGKVRGQPCGQGVSGYTIGRLIRRLHNSGKRLYSLLNRVI